MNECDGCLGVRTDLDVLESKVGRLAHLSLGNTVGVKNVWRYGESEQLVFVRVCGMHHHPHHIRWLIQIAPLQPYRMTSVSG